MMARMIRRILAHSHQTLLEKYPVEHVAEVSVLSEIRSSDSIILSNLVPLVTILIGGNLHALRSISKDLEKGIPVLIMDVS